MTLKPGQTYYGGFVTSNAFGGAANADSLPTATANHNNVDDAAFALTVANLATGRYSVTGTVPAGYAAGDRVVISVSATIGGVAASAIIDTFDVDTVRLSDGVNVTKWLGTEPAALNDSAMLQVDVAQINGSGSTAVAMGVFFVDAAQNVRDAMKRTPTAGAAAAGSIDAQIAALPTAAANADAVWDEIATGHVLTGSTAVALTAINTKTATIGSISVAVSSPISNGDEIDIVAGADHTGTRGWTWSYTGHDLTAVGTTARLRLITAGHYACNEDTSALETVATISATNATSGTVAGSMTAAQSATLTADQASHAYRYQVQIVPAAGDAWVLAQGWANVSLFHDAVPSA